MNVSLPGALKDWVDEQVRVGKFDDAEDYVHSLIIQDQERSMRLAELQALVTEGLESGVSSRSKAEILELARTSLRSPPVP